MIRAATDPGGSADAWQATEGATSTDLFVFNIDGGLIAVANHDCKMVSAGAGAR